MHLLSIDMHELDVVHIALVMFAQHCEQEGDTSTAKMADEISDRTRALESITSEPWVDWVRHVGLGRFRGRPQG